MSYGRTCKVTVDVDSETLLTTDNMDVYCSAQERFAPPRKGNKAHACVTGREYYSLLVEDILGAKDEIIIVGWQVNWDVQLAPEDKEKSHLRLYDLLKEVVTRQPELTVRIMVWEGSPAALYTYSDDTKRVLESINEDEKVGREAIIVQLAKMYADDTPSFFSHHQKFVIIDKKTAYLGGIDLAYGRYDDERYHLHPEMDPALKNGDIAGRQMLNRYNPCIAWVGKHSDSNKLVDPDLLTGFYDRLFNRSDEIEKINSGGWQGGKEASVNPYRSINDSTLDPDKQPRMPWQDVQAKIVGPVVFDILRNFALRWNIQAKASEVYPLPVFGEYPEFEKQSSGDGSVTIQVLRSAAKGLCEKERSRVLRYFRTEGERYPEPESAQKDIYDTAIKLIRAATDYIYIESQFFISNYGEVRDVDKNMSYAAESIRTWAADSGTDIFGNLGADACDHNSVHNGVKDEICNVLHAHLMEQAGKKNQEKGFHVYIVLPVHPEGKLTDSSVMSTVFHTYQTLVHGETSLLKRLRRSIAVKELIDKSEGVLDRNDAETLGVQVDKTLAERPEGDAITSEDYEKCKKYVTLLNLRNWEKLDTHYVTEQIYVHTKSMIVDDRFAIIGSANFNERSLLGTRDSEIALLFVDEKTEGMARCFAKDYRVALWKKLFGRTETERSVPERGVDKETFSKWLEEPGSESTSQGIGLLAERNSVEYEKVFNYIPRNYFNSKEEPYCSYFPTSAVRDNNEKIDVSTLQLPFNETFWSDNDSSAYKITSGEELNNVKGYVTAFPVFWGMKERNNAGISSGLTTDNRDYSEETDTKMAKAEPQEQEEMNV